MAPNPRKGGWTILLAALPALLALAGACSSGNEVNRDAAAGATGTGGNAGATGTGGECPPRTAYTEASHLVVTVNWPAGLAAMGGTSQVHIWGKVAFTVTGNMLSGTLQACGITLPPTTLTALAGGGMLQIEIPSAAWDAPTMPRFQVSGTQTGWTVGGTLLFSYAAPIGFTVADPFNAPWPASYTGITMTTDAENDMHVGLTAIPRSGTGYTLPPTSIQQTSRVDQLYIVTRQATEVTLTRTSCEGSSGTAQLVHFDNHVVGCHVMGGSDCVAGEINFVDTNRTIYTVMSATAETKIIADTATCADVRAALP